MRLLTLAFVEAGVNMYFVPFIAAQSELLPGDVAQPGFAFINMASAAGYASVPSTPSLPPSLTHSLTHSLAHSHRRYASGPVLTGALLQASGSFVLPFVVLACLSTLPITLMVLLIRSSARVSE